MKQLYAIQLCDIAVWYNWQYKFIMYLLPQFLLYINDLLYKFENM